MQILGQSLVFILQQVLHYPAACSGGS